MYDDCALVDLIMGRGVADKIVKPHTKRHVTYIIKVRQRS